MRKFKSILLVILGLLVLFPLGLVGVYQWFQGFLNGVLGWLPIVFNSLLWAAVIVGILMAATKVKTSQNKPSEATP